METLTAMQEDQILEENLERFRENRDKHLIEEKFNIDIDPFEEDTLIAPIDGIDRERPNLEKTTLIMKKIREAIEFKRLVIDTHDLEERGLIEILMEVGFADVYLNTAERNILMSELMDIAEAEQLRELSKFVGTDLTGLESIDRLIYNTNDPGEL